MKFRKKEKEQYNFHFVPCKDSEGNVLGPEDILFVGKEERKKIKFLKIQGKEGSKS